MPVDEVGEPVKLMPLINHVVQAVAEEVDIRGESRLIGTHFFAPEIARNLRVIIRKPAISNHCYCNKYLIYSDS